MKDNENIDNLIDAETKKLEAQLETVEKGRRDIDELRRAEWREMESKVVGFEEKIKEIKKPYEQKFKEIEKTDKDLEHKKWELERQIRNITYKVCYDQMKNNGTAEFPDEDAFKGFLQAHSIYCGHIKMTKKALANGVRIFKHTDTIDVSDAFSVGYFAVKGADIIGFQHTEKSQHAGDEPSYDAWINVKVLDREKQFTFKYDDTYTWDGKKIVRQKTPSFRAFCAEVEKLKKFVPIDLNDEQNRKILGRD